MGLWMLSLVIWWTVSFPHYHSSSQTVLCHSLADLLYCWWVFWFSRAAMWACFWVTIFASTWVISFFHHRLKQLLDLDHGTATSFVFCSVLCRLLASSRVDTFVFPFSPEVMLFLMTSLNLSQFVSRYTCRCVNLGTMVVDSFLHIPHGVEEVDISSLDYIEGLLVVGKEEVDILASCHIYINTFPGLYLRNIWLFN